jgi:DNA polymerase III delta' subunit
MSFKDVHGQRRVKNIFVKALKQNRVPNSLLFSGPEGVGKKDFAREAAKALNCEKKTDDACDACASCRSIAKGSCPDVMFIAPPRDVVKIEQIRLLKSTAYLKPMAGKKRIFIVEEAEKMNTESSNSLLKVLEEPPAFSHIILMTHNPFMILPTVKSRCQVLTFSPMSRKEIRSALLERGWEDDRAEIISLLVNGNMRQALQFDWADAQERRELSWKIFGSLLSRDGLSPLLESFYSTRDTGRKELEQTLEFLASFFRDLILLKEKGEKRLLMNPDFEDHLHRFADALSVDQTLDFLDRIDFGLYGLRKNLNLNLLVTSLFSGQMEWSHV